MEEDIKLLEEMKANCIKGMMKGAIYTDEKAERKALAIENIIKEYKDSEDILKNITKENLEYKQYIRELEKENKELKASHIITHNKVSSEEKAKLFDVIDTSIDTYLEQTKPYWEQIMTKEKMTSEEAERIIDDMYQDRNKILRKTQETETEVIFDVAKLDDVKFTNLEFASVRALREIQSLRRELKNSIPKSKIKEKIEELKKEYEIALEENSTKAFILKCQIDILEKLMEDK